VHWDDIAWASSDTTRFAVSGSIRHPFWSVGPGGPIWPSVEYVFVADAERKTVRLLRTGSDAAYTLMWSPDGRRLLGSGREQVLIDVATGDSLALPEAHDGTAVRPIAWAGPSTLLFASSISSWRRLTAYHLNTKRWTPITKLRIGDRFVQFSPADTASAVTDRDLVIRRSLGKHDEFQLVLLRQPQGLEKAIRSSERRRAS
jgi:WD40 repeat protein